MKGSLKWVTVVILIGGGLSAWSWSPRAGVSAREDDKAEAKVKPPYVHTVIFYLKKDAPRDETEKIIADAHGLLAKIPSVKGLWIGRPADKATPELAVSDYHVAWVLLFDDYAGLQEYLDHKLHLEFREKHAKNAERVLIYDFVNQKK